MRTIKFGSDGLLEIEQLFIRRYYQLLKSKEMIYDLPLHSMKRLGWTYEQIGLTNGCNLNCLWCSKAQPNQYKKCQTYLSMCKRYYNYMGE